MKDNKKRKDFIPPPGFTKLTVDKDCDLRTFIETRELLYYRGCTFYEFDNETEDIEEGKKVILIDKEVIYNIII